MPRGLDVLRLIVDGRFNSEIAATLVIGHEAFKNYVSRILSEPDLRARVQDVVYAYRDGLATWRIIERPAIRPHSLPQAGPAVRSRRATRSGRPARGARARRRHRLRTTGRIPA